jgi:hypothetical protein
MINLILSIDTVPVLKIPIFRRATSISVNGRYPTTMIKQDSQPLRLNRVTHKDKI